MIIPHRFSVNRKEKEKKAGTFNVSMLTFRCDKNGLACLMWWREKCIEWCFNRLENNKLGDQFYLNEFPKLFKKVHVLKYSGANVAPWNITQYKVSSNSSAIYVDGVLLVFFHFLGLKLYDKKFMLPATSPLGYGDHSLYRKLIYEIYFKEMYNQTINVRKIDANFSSGFAKRPNNWLKETIADAYLQIYSRLFKT